MLLVVLLPLAAAMGTAAAGSLQACPAAAAASQQLHILRC
jgi:hypothetical protein